MCSQYLVERGESVSMLEISHTSIFMTICKPLQHGRAMAKLCKVGHLHTPTEQYCCLVEAMAAILHNNFDMFTGVSCTPKQRHGMLLLC